MRRVSLFNSRSAGYRKTDWPARHAATGDRFCRPASDLTLAFGAGREREREIERERERERETEREKERERVRERTLIDYITVVYM